MTYQANASGPGRINPSPELGNELFHTLQWNPERRAHGVMKSFSDSGRERFCESRMTITGLLSAQN
jgi:hypothetical protein